jgi:hypothetical protein
VRVVALSGQRAVSAVARWGRTAASCAPGRWAGKPDLAAGRTARERGRGVLGRPGAPHGRVAGPPVPAAWRVARRREMSAGPDVPERLAGAARGAPVRRRVRVVFPRAAAGLQADARAAAAWRERAVPVAPAQRSAGRVPAHPWVARDAARAVLPRARLAVSASRLAFRLEPARPRHPPGRRGSCVPAMPPR